MSTLLQEIRRCAEGPAADGASGRTMTFIFPPSFIGFQGHFPVDPILPGMVQIMSGIITAETTRPLTLIKVGRAKFSRIIKPLEPVRVIAATSEKNETIQAHIQITVHEEVAATLTLELAPAGGGR